MKKKVSLVLGMCIFAYAIWWLWKELEPWELRNAYRWEFKVKLADYVKECFEKEIEKGTMAAI